MKNAVLIDNLSVHFQGTRLFDGFSLAVNCGEKITIAGPSGGGKSTLLRCIMGFTPATKGIIRIFDRELTASSIWQLRGKMAYVAQEPELGAGTVRAALMRPFGYRINGDLSYDEEEALRLFSIFRLPASLLDKDIPLLSGGEKQRVALVAALLLQRPILLLDEAASALDGASKEVVRTYLCARTDLTILSVSHDIRDFSLSETVVTIPGETS
jgi:putative ABC transport system ATP-binding protein